MSPDHLERISARVRKTFVDEGTELLRDIDRILRALRAGDATGQVPELRRRLHTLKGTAAATGMDAIRDLAHEMEELLQPLADQAPEADAEVVHLLYTSLDEVAEHIQALQSELPGAEPSPLGGEDGAASVALEESAVRLSARRVDELQNLVGELVVLGLQRRDLDQRLRDLRHGFLEVQEGWEELRSELAALQGDLPEGRYRSLVERTEAIGSQLDLCAGHANGAARDLPRDSAQTSNIVTALDHLVGELRLIPLQSFLEDYGGALRAACRTTGKRARLEVQAAGVEVDRAVLSLLRDPLTHLITNAVAHGIAPPEERRRRGKPEEGTIRLEAFSEGNRARIRVVDDGEGVDREVIRHRGRALGLEIEEGPLDDERVLEILSQPGFTSQHQVDEVSGRGVGLDSVLSAVRRLDGRLTLDSMPGLGCAFTVEVPISASSAAGCRIRLGDREFGLVINHVETIVRVPRERITTLGGRRVFFLNSEPVPLVELEGELGLTPARPDGAEAAVVVVLRQLRDLLGFEVAGVPEEQQLVIKPLGRSFAKARLFLGGAVRADHSIVPVFHTPELFRRAAQGRAPRSLAGPSTRAPARAARRVLAVEDSLTMRMMLRQLLEADGYAVELANDGADAEQKLRRTEHPFDIVVTDLEMPRKDGIQLCETLRRDLGSQIPVVIVTSVSAPEERTRAMEAGADAYILKRELEQETFLRLVGELSGGGETHP